MGCARCHDHKFDPVTQDDFYSMFAFFNSIEEPGLYTQTPDSKRAYEPFIEVPTPEQTKTLEEIKTYLASLAEQMEKPFPGEQAKREAEALATESQKALAESLERRSKLAEEKIARAEAQAVSEVRSAAVDVAVATAERILKAKVTGSQADAIVEDAIRDLKGRLN